MRLLTECNVSIRKLPFVIETVLGKLADTKVTRLPSTAFLSRIYSEAKLIASKQVAEAMLAGADPTDQVGNVLHQDATTKYHAHYEGMQVTLKDERNMSMGLENLAGGSGEDYVAAFKDIIEDLAEACTKETETEERKATLIVSLKCLMSDQCATNHIFNEAIEKMRKALLPAVAGNLENFKEEVQEMMTMFKFAFGEFCACCRQGPSSL